MSIQGHEGSIKVATNEMGNAKVWSLDITADMQDVTTLGDEGWKKSDQGLKSWSGSITAIFDTSGLSEVSLITSGIMTGAKVALELQVGDGAGADTLDTYSGDAKITTVGIVNDVNGIIEVSFDYEGYGLLTIA